MPFTSHPDDVFLHLGELPPGKQRFEVVLPVVLSTDAIVLVDNRSQNHCVGRRWTLPLNLLLHDMFIVL